MWELGCKESWAPKNWCFWTVVLEKTLESPLDCKEIQPVHPKGDQSWVFVGRTDWCWNWNSNTLATWCEELTLLKKPWCWERLKAGEEGDYRGWDGWIASPTQWTWVWVHSGVGDGQGSLALLQSMGSQRVRHDWAAKLTSTELCTCSVNVSCVKVKCLKKNNTSDPFSKKWSLPATPYSGVWSWLVEFKGRKPQS